jgi:cation diffusion facilitator family transporter
MAIDKEAKDSGAMPHWSKPRPVHKYYHSMNQWLEMMNELNEIPNYSVDFDEKSDISFCVRCAAYCSFGMNLCLLMGKALAISTSSSYTIMSSLADSLLDIIGSVIISFTASSRGADDDHIQWPAGKSRISIIGILVFSVLMGCCAIYIILACVNSLVIHESGPPTTPTAVFVMVMSVVVKFLMWFVYRWIGHPITVILAEEHQNDVIINSLGLFMYWGGARLHWWMDSAGGILIALFVLRFWILNAWENARMMMGEAAPPEVIRSLTYLAAHHHPLIKSVDKVIAYRIGPMYFAEVYVIMREGIGFQAASWVGDTLAVRLENIPNIERAFVHLDSVVHDEKLASVLEKGISGCARDDDGKIVFEAMEVV